VKNSPWKKIRNMSAFILAGMFLFSCHPKQELSPEDAIRALKVLDSDMTNLVSKGQEHPSVTSLAFLLNQASSPLSTNSGMPAILLKDSLQNLGNWNGTYTWNKDSLKFLKTPGKVVKMIFPMAGDLNNDVSCTISMYSSQPSMSAKCFPAELLGTMEYKGKEILKILYKAEFRENWPSKIQFEISGDGFEGYCHMERRRLGDNGVIITRFDFSASGKNVLEGKIKTDIGYNGNQIFVKTIEPEIRLFEMNINGVLDYSKVDPTGEDYIKSFNDNCHILFRESRNKKIIGNFGLGKEENGDLLEWTLYLSDGSKASLQDYILVFKKLMDFKYPNKKNLH
jgi:hypothetical protein